LLNYKFHCDGEVTAYTLIVNRPGHVNRFAGAGNFAVGYASIAGQFDTSDPFCANLPKGAKPGTKPEPGAVAQLVVTDTSGAEAGPFQLPITPACKAVKPVSKLKAEKHKRHGKAAAKRAQS
jgi:hypothetical protein